MQGQANGKISPWAVWIAVAGAGASGLSGIGSMGQLNDLQAAVEEQIRVAELRGQLLAEIRANRNLIEILQAGYKDTMPQAGILRLHDAQQELIKKLIDWTEVTVTKNELELAIGKMRALRDQ